MYAPRVFLSMIAVLIVFAVSAYAIAGSFLTALIATIVCAVILQFGYFLGILYLVRREKEGSDATRAASLSAARQRKDGAVLDDVVADAATRLRANDR